VYRERKIGKGKKREKHARKVNKKEEEKNESGKREGMIKE
jgi:hypothetical protein